MPRTAIEAHLREDVQRVAVVPPLLLRALAEDHAGLLHPDRTRLVLEGRPTARDVRQVGVFKKKMAVGCSVN